MYELVTISGQENTVGIPVYIPTLNLEGSKIAGGSQEVIIPMAGVEGAEVIIAPNSVKLPDGRSEGRIMFSQVQTDKVPMPAPHGSVFDVAWTLQPSGTEFNPPARISLPNANGGKPGEEQEMFSFDHDLMEWVSIGPGVVSDDGSRITSREGFGVRHAGWGGAPPPPPPPTCNIKCNDGNECTSDSKSDCFCTNKLIPDKVKSDQTEGNCQTELCSGSRDNNGDIPQDSTAVGDCQISGCESGTPTPVDDNGDKPRPEDNPDNFCKTCDEGGIVADASKDDQVLPSDECKVCLNGKAENLEITDVVAKAEGQDEYVTKFVTSGTNVNFTGSATGDNCNFEYEWGFGDGGTSNQQNPTHSYTAAGEYLVEFKVNCQGCPSSEKKETVKVLIEPVRVELIDIDLTSKELLKLTYEVKDSEVLNSGIFTFGSFSSEISNQSETFSFVINPQDVPLDSQLNASFNYNDEDEISIDVGRFNLQALGSEIIQGEMFLSNGVFHVRPNHNLTERYDIVTVSSSLGTSEIVSVGRSGVALAIQTGVNLPNKVYSWVESHHFSTDVLGKHNQTTMIDSEGIGSIPGVGQDFKYKELVSDRDYSVSTSFIEGVATINSLNLEDSSGHPVVVILLFNKEVDAVIELNGGQ